MKWDKILTAVLFLIGTVCYSQSIISKSCDPDKPLYYAAEETNIYQSANVNSAIVTKVPRGEAVRVVSSDGIRNSEMWYICYKGKAGHALRRLLSYDKITLGEPAPKNTEEPALREPISQRISGLFAGTNSGSIGGGLENRGGSGPEIQDRSQEQGKVVIRVCVNSSGKVISADYTQRGSTTQSRTLINLAKKNAMQYSFNSSPVDKQCGTIVYNFAVM